MKLLGKYIVLLILVSFLSACENEPTIVIPEHHSKLVVEGWIDQNFGARVFLTLSAPFFDDIDSINLRDFAATTAKVTVRSGNMEEILTLKPNAIYFPPYYYFGSTIRGQMEQQYSIEIQYRGNTYNAETSIPALVPIDSAWFVPGESDTTGNIMLRFTDDPSTENFYRILTKRLGKDSRFIPVQSFALSDKGFNGKEMQMLLRRGSSNTLDISNDGLFLLGDTVVIRFCSIDKAHFEFWKSHAVSTLSSANPFSVNNKAIMSNISNGLGVWGGNAVWYDTVIAK